MSAIFDDDDTANSKFIESLPNQIGDYEIDKREQIRPHILGGFNTKNSQKVVFKFSAPEDNKLDNEYQILSRFSNPFIIKPLHYFDKSFKEFKVLVLERAIGLDLNEFIRQYGSIEERHVCEMIFSLLNALKCLHSLGIAHLDIKLENILCLDDTANPQVVLADFGLAAELGIRKTGKGCIGTPAFMAPEIHRNRKYNNKVDLWSIGVVMYICLFNSHPFSPFECLDYFDYDINKLLEGKFEIIQTDPPVSEEAAEFLSHLLEVDPDKRYSANQALEDPWFEQNLYVQVKNNVNIIENELPEDDDNEIEGYSQDSM